MSARDSDHPVGALRQFLQARRLDAPGIAGVVVALSGGPDSLTLLLAAAAAVPETGLRLRALHVHHGLHADADAWAAQAMAQSAAAGVPCRVLRVRVADEASLEAAARRARYDALAAALAPDEALLLAHHQDDQAETLLLRLMRGAGLHGLAGMRPLSSWRGADGRTIARWRPWLALPRTTLERWRPRALACLRSHAPSLPEAALLPVADPANHDARFDRSLLRHELLPLLASRWPEAAGQLARSAAQLAAQASALDALADALLASAGVRADAPGPLPLPMLAALDDAALQAVLARWLVRRGAAPLPVRYWPRVRGELLAAREDAQPRLEWAGWHLRRYRDGIFLCSPDNHDAAGPDVMPWPDVCLPLVLDGWCLQLLNLPDIPVQQGWSLRRRRDGDRWRPAGRRLQSLKSWCQQQGIPPWQRDRLWLLCRDDEIAAVLVGDRVIPAAGLFPARLEATRLGN